MAGGAFARVQPGGAFGLQVSDGAIDRLLDLLRSCRGNRDRFVGKGRAVKGKAPEETPRTRMCEPWIDPLVKEQ